MPTSIFDIYSVRISVLAVVVPAEFIDPDAENNFHIWVFADAEKK